MRAATMSGNFTDLYKKDELIADYTVERQIDYKDVDYLVPRQDVQDIRRRLEILRRFDNGNVRVKYWNKLQNVGKDSPACFIEMLRYVRNFEFRFHKAIEEDSQEGSGEEVEWSWVFKKLQTNKKHRIEMLPGNIDLSGLVADLNEVAADVSVVFNIGGNRHLLSSALYSMRSLVWLNMSDSNVSNGKVHSLLQVINRGGLPNLCAIVLTGNPGVDVTMLEEDLRRLTTGKLQYLEGDWDELPENGAVLRPLAVSSEFRLMGDAGKLAYLVRTGLIGRAVDVLVEYSVCNGFSWSSCVQAGVHSSSRGRSFAVHVDVERARRVGRAEGRKVAGTRADMEGRPVVRRRDGDKSSKTRGMEPKAGTKPTSKKTKRCP